MLNNYFKKYYYWRALRELANLQRLLFSSYFNQENNDKKIHQQRLKVISVVKKNPVSELLQIGDVIFSINQLRHRIKDFSILEICIRELTDIGNLSALFIRDRKKFSNAYLGAIHQFENLYGNTLRVVVPDPLVFMFFIQDLYALYEKVTALNER